MSKIKFGTDGWRDIIAENFTFPNVRLVARAIADYVRGAYPADRPVVIGYDTRFLAKDFATAVAEVLEGAGIHVLLSNRDVPTPVIAFAAKHLNTAGAIMLTASHNPPQYCGIKYIPDYAGPATKDITDQIVANVERLQRDGIDWSEQKTPIASFDPMPAYLDWIQDKVDFEAIRKANLKVVFDPLYGTGRGYVDTILQGAGCQVDSIHAFVDPLFGGGMPEPNPRYLADLRERILKTGADLGLATDGDADRFGVMDEGGNYFTPNQVIALLLRHLVKNRKAKGSVVRTVATTHLIDRIAAHYGLSVHETPVGFKWVGEKMRQDRVVIGGEESGGLSVLGHIPEKDGILADLLVAEMVAVEQKPLSAIWRDLINEVGFEPANKRLDLHLTEREKEAVLCSFNDVSGRFGELKIERRENVDGTKFILEDGSWILARPSGTEPIIRIYLEAPGQEKLGRLETEVNRLVQSTQVASH